MSSRGRGSARGTSNRATWRRPDQNPQQVGSSRRSQDRVRLENIASVSRSSGLEKDGDDLKNFRIQEEYRAFVQERVKAVFGASLDGKDDDHRKAQRQNVLIQFRKLREGLYSSKRHDGFALEVYETSLFLAITFSSLPEANAILTNLVPDLYTAVPGPHPHRSISITIVQLLNLVNNYPSQRAYFDFLAIIERALLGLKSDISEWISEVAKSLRTRNFVKFNSLTVPASVARIWEHNPPPPDDKPRSGSDMARQAFETIVELLRAKARESAWAVLRSAYREFWCHAGSETKEWLSNVLGLTLALSDEKKDASFSGWLNGKVRDGQLKPKEGVEGRWIICKIKG